MNSEGERGAAANAQFSSEQVKASEERDVLRRRADEELPKEVEELKALAAGAEAALVESKMSLNTAQSSHSEKLTSLQSGVSHYACTGLTFDRAGDNKLKLVFTQIDPTRPGREFTFTLNVNDMTKYEVTECTPAVEGVDALVDAVNVDNDFGGFVKAMRKGFVGLV